MRQILKTAIISLIFILGCSKPPSETYEPELDVFGLLIFGISSQQIKISRSYKMDEPSVYDLENVQAILYGDTFSDTLVSKDDTSGIFFSSESLNILPLHTYYLNVSADGMSSVEGKTIVPGNFQIVYPQQNDTISTFDTLLLKKSKNAGGYYITYYCTDSLNYHKDIRIVPQETTLDTLIKIYGVLLWEGPAVIKVAAIDTNYYQYVGKLFGFIENRNAKLQEGINGGLGVFGSAVVESVNVVIKQ